MPDITVSMPSADLARLQACVDADNARTGQTLTIRQWVARQLQEAVADFEGSQQIEAAAQTARVTERENLITGVDIS